MRVPEYARGSRQAVPELPAPPLPVLYHQRDGARRLLLLANLPLRRFPRRRRRRPHLRRLVRLPGRAHHLQLLRRQRGCVHVRTLSP